MNALSLWLMSADYQAINNRRNKLAFFKQKRSTDVILIVSNEEQGNLCFWYGEI